MLSITCVPMCDTNAILRCNYAQLRPRSVLGWPLIREIIACYLRHLAHCVKIDGPSHAIAYVMPGISCSICVTRLPMGGPHPCPLFTNVPPDWYKFSSSPSLYKI